MASPTSTPTAQTTSASRGLSGGAVAGIAVGSAAGALAVAAVIAWLCLLLLRRRQQNADQSKESGGEGFVTTQPAVLPPYEKTPFEKIRSASPVEAPAISEAQELGDDGPRVERVELATDPQ